MSSQEAFRSVDPPAVTEVSKVIEQGRRLEDQGRWAEALSHYEDAARHYPTDEQLKNRVVETRMHFDVNRRYADRSFLQLTKTLNEQQAIDLFAEVVTKVQSNYVHEPNWNDLLRRGTQGLTVAFGETAFHEVYAVDFDSRTSTPLLKHVEQVLSQRDIRDRREAQELVRWVGQLAERRLHLPCHAVVLEYMCSAMNSLDPYSTYLTADQLDEVYSQIEGNFVGLGIELKGDDGALLIANVIAKGPADRAGLRIGDRIIEVDGQPTQGLSTDRAADLLKGEQGTFVEVKLASNDGDARRLQVRRERVEVPSVEDVKILDADNGVGYFRISSFQKTTSRDVDAALWKLHREGMRSLIVDVRGNPGGLLNEAVEVVDRFVVDGTIVATHGRSARENYDYKAHRVGTWRVPLVVLIDGDSASASEIFAGAIRDHARGTIVGERSYGKGSVQGIFPLRTVKAGVRLTTAKFYSPSGKAISDGGVLPNVTVHVASRPDFESGTPLPPQSDEVLLAGTRVARELTMARTQPSTDRPDRSAQVDLRRDLEASGRDR